MYSKKAIPQLTRIVAMSGAFLYLRCPYQATVMKVLEIIRSTIVLSCILSPSSLYGFAKSRFHDLLACEAGVSIKPGAQAPGSNVKKHVRAREYGRQLESANAVARIRGLFCFLIL